LFLLVATLALVSTTASAAHGRRKLAPDLSKFPTNSDGTIDVIIQFNQTPQARHFQMMASRGGRLKFSFKHINGAAYRIPARLLAWLETHPDVAYVTPDRPTKAAWDDDVPAVMDDIALQQFGVNGSGIGIAVIDSGVYQHNDLKNANNTGSRIVYSESFVPGDTSTNDAYGHGTHVAGILAGNGHDSQSGYSQHYTGIAPNANIINLRVLDAKGSGTDSRVIAAIQRAIQLKDTYNIRIINISLGRGVFESYTDDPLCQAAEAAWRAGIVVVVAAGNSGRDNSMGTQGYATIQAPGNAPDVITVGATKTNGTPSRLDDTVASYSSKGPTLLDHIVKPDIVAPGNRIVSLAAPGSTLVSGLLSLNVTGNPNCVLGICIPGPSGKYTRLSGTSMATPIVAGAAALMLQNDPTLTPDTVKARMMKTAWKGYPSNSWGHDRWGHGYFSQYDVFTIGAGYLDVYAALRNTDVATGGAASPITTFNSATGQATLVNGNSIVWGNSIIWGSTTIWADSIIWGSGIIEDPGDPAVETVVGGNAIVWGTTGVIGNVVIWADSIVWGDLPPDPPLDPPPGDDGTVGSFSDGEDGED